MVWKENDSYYLRGVPIDENGTTIELKPAASEGYARNPFLLFDSMVELGQSDREQPRAARARRHNDALLRAQG